MLNRNCVLIGLLALSALACSDGSANDGGAGNDASAGTGAQAGEGGGGAAGANAGAAGASAGSGGLGGNAGASSSAGAGGTSGGDAGLEDAGPESPLEWEPLETTATPACTHPHVPADLSPAAYLEVFSDATSNARETAVLGYDGRYVSLRCPDDLWASHATPSADRRKVLYGTDKGFHVTSWLLDGVFALPKEVDGLQTDNYFWLNDEYLVTDAVRRTDGSTIADRALVVVRWDGTQATRLEGAVRLDQDERDYALSWPGNDRFGVYRLDADAEPGFEYYRVEFPSLTSTPLASGLGEMFGTIQDAFDPETGHMLIAGDQRPINFDYLFYLDVESGELVDLDTYIEAGATLSPDGQYAAFPITGAYGSQRLSEGSEAIEYDALYHTSMLVFDPSGHRFASTTDDKELVIVDPETGEMSDVLHDPIEEGAEGIQQVVYAPDGAGVYFTATLTVAGEPTLYYAPIAGPAAALAPSGQYAIVRPSPDGDHVALQIEDSLSVVGRDGSARDVPLPAGIESPQSIAWSSSSKTLLIRGTRADDVGTVLLWDIDEAEAQVLLADPETGYGGPISVLGDVISLLP